MEIGDNEDASTVNTEPKKEKTLNQIIKGGEPKRKKRKAGRYGKKKNAKKK